MKIHLESTSTIVELITPQGGPVPARIWEGHTESGIPIHCYITRLAVRQDDPRQAEFVRELQECPPPSTVDYVFNGPIPLRLIL